MKAISLGFRACMAQPAKNLRLEKPCRPGCEESRKLENHMKITFVMTYAGFSGGTRVIATHARNLIARGHHVEVFSTAALDPLA